MIIEHSGDFKVVHPKTKEVRYDSNCHYLYGGNMSVDTNSSICNYTVETAGINSDYWEKHYDEEEVTKKDQILGLLKGETFYVIKDILEEVFEEVQEKAKY